MSDVKAKWAAWDSFQQVTIILLAVCAFLLAANSVLAWLYLSTTSQSIARALSPIKEQQTDLNVRLDVVRGELDSNLTAIRDELNALNEKASKAADVTPPGNDASQP